MHDTLSAFLLVYAGLFPVVNPLGSAPIFLAMTDSCSDQERNRLAATVSINSFWLLLGSMLGGSLILEVFGITVPVVRVAGGLLLATMGWKVLNDGHTGDDPKSTSADVTPGQSFYPLTLPLTVGPGVIAVAITLGSHRPHGPDFLMQVGAGVAGLVAMALTVYVCYRSAENLARALGQTGIGILIRLSAFILICIGIQICWSGVKALIQSL
ncbi:MarC family protein [Pseudorhodoplanes sp.]|uniref:MarC family protein n=1 Tax=Pseudorhodoplanes sp. TaxID=1934341 RepID=UPI002BDA88F3|nr:MarC family protein [Pseudorhodoplanes sp.]HWV54106.1 MarC family protein [Pseudorhodoplanes sp.]